jgi:hypothetical protein
MRLDRRALKGLFVLVALAAPHRSLAQTLRVGTEFQVNAYTIDDQEFPSAAMDGDGDFVAV